MARIEKDSTFHEQGPTPLRMPTLLIMGQLAGTLQETKQVNNEGMTLVQNYWAESFVGKSNVTLVQRHPSRL